MTAPEFSRPFVVDRLGPNAASLAIEATPDERARLAERFGIVAIDRFTASIELRRRQGGLIAISGRFEADLVQNCVVTLEPFPSHVGEAFTADFTEAPTETEHEVSLDPDYEPPEPIEHGVIDLGELAAQFLSLAIDPHPRSPNATLDQVWSKEDEPKLSPFAALEKLKPRR